MNAIRLTCAGGAFSPGCRRMVPMRRVASTALTQHRRFAAVAETAEPGPSRLLAAVRAELLDRRPGVGAQTPAASDAADENVFFGEAGVASKPDGSGLMLLSVLGKRPRVREAMEAMRSHGRRTRSLKKMLSDSADISVYQSATENKKHEVWVALASHQQSLGAAAATGPEVQVVENQSQPAASAAAFAADADAAAVRNTSLEQKLMRQEVQLQSLKTSLLKLEAELADMRGQRDELRAQLTLAEAQLAEMRVPREIQDEQTDQQVEGAAHQKLPSLPAALKTSALAEHVQTLETNPAVNPPLPALPLPPAPQRLVLASGSPAWLEHVALGVEALDESLRPSEEHMAAQADLLESLRGLVAPLGGQLTCYGSHATGLHTLSSDLDITWVRAPQGDTADDIRRWTIGELRSLLEIIGDTSADRLHGSEVVTCGPCLQKFAARCRLIFCSRRRGAPPVLKLESSSGENLCDITLNNWDGMRNSALLRTLGDCSPSFRILGRVVKHWARRRGIADRARGRLSTYGLMLMLAGTLQKHGAMLTPAAMESLCDRLRAAGQDLDAIEQAAVFDAEPGLEEAGVAELLLHFFEMYSNSKEQHVVALAGQVQKAEHPSLPSFVVNAASEVRCPLTAANIEAQLASRHWRRLIFPEFARMVALLSGARERGERAGWANNEAVAVDLAAMCGPTSSPSLQTPPPPPPPPKEPPPQAPPFPPAEEASPHMEVVSEVTHAPSPARGVARCDQTGPAAEDASAKVRSAARGDSQSRPQDPASSAEASVLAPIAASAITVAGQSPLMTVGSQVARGTAIEGVLPPRPAAPPPPKLPRPPAPPELPAMIHSDAS